MSAIDSRGRRKAFCCAADEKLSAFVQFESTIGVAPEPLVEVFDLFHKNLIVIARNVGLTGALVFLG